MSYAALGFATDVPGPFPGGWCLDPHATKYASGGRLGCFCNAGYVCSAPEDPTTGCVDGDCVEVAQSTPYSPGSLAEQVCLGAGLSWDANTGQCVQGAVAPAPPQQPHPQGLPPPAPVAPSVPVAPSAQQATVAVSGTSTALVLGGVALVVLTLASLLRGGA